MDYENWKQLVTSLRFVGDVEQCLETLQAGLALHTHRSGVHRFAAEQFAHLGHHMEALQHYDEAVRADPKDVESLLCGALLLSELGSYDEAEMRFRAVKELDGDGGVTLFHKQLCEPGDSLTVHRQRSRELMELAESSWQEGDLVEAQRFAEAACAVVDSPEVRLFLGRLLLAQGEAEKALESLEHGRRLEPEWSAFQNLAARCFLALGKVKQAKDALLRAELLGDSSFTGKVLRREAQDWSRS